MELSGHEWQRAEEVLGCGAKGARGGGEGQGKGGRQDPVVLGLTALVSSPTLVGLLGAFLSGGQKGSSQSAWGWEGGGSFPLDQPQLIT